MLIAALFLASVLQAQAGPSPAPSVSPSPAPTPDLNASDVPAPQAGNKVWEETHTRLIERAKAGGIDLYFIGDSITRRWEATRRENWDRNFAGWRPADFGQGGDRTQNVLYRIENGEIEGVHPKVVVLMIGTNNIGFEPPAGDPGPLIASVERGVRACIEALRRKAPNAKVVLMGITPRNTRGTTVLMPIIDGINARIAKLADGKTARFISLNERLADESGRIREGMTDDGLHFTEAAYQVWADALMPTLTEWMGPKTKP